MYASQEFEYKSFTIPSSRQNSHASSPFDDGDDGEQQQQHTLLLILHNDNSGSSHNNFSDVAKKVSSSTWKNDFNMPIVCDSE